MATRRHNSDKGHARPETSPELDSWDELAERVGVEGALYLHDPAVFSRIKIGRFDAQVEIGRGGFGIVFKAMDPKLKRWVALKLCPRSQTAIEELMHEAQVLAALNHPNIVAVLEPPGEFEGSAFFAMPYIDGQNVRQFAKRKPRPTWWKILDVFIDVASGLAAAHGADPPIIHGDVKPSNMLLDRDDFARIADFGLARRMIEDADESEQEGLRHRAGTLYYMAPERLRGEPGDARSDQFSFCVALYETLDGGMLPFVGNTSAELLDDIEHTEVQFEDSSIPIRILAVLRIGLSSNPCDRFPDMKTLRAELIRLRRSAPDESVLDDPPQPDDAEPDDEPPPSHETTPDKPPPDAPPPLLGEGAPDQPELTPVGGGPAPSKAKRGVGSVSLVLAVGLTLGWLGRGRVEGPRPSDDPVPLPSLPCALGDDAVGSSVAIDPAVIAACTYIRQGRFVDATRYWNAVWMSRRDAIKNRVPTLEDSPDKLAADTMIVVQTYGDQAKRLAREGKQGEAELAAADMAAWTPFIAYALALADANGSTGASSDPPVVTTD